MGWFAAVSSPLPAPSLPVCLGRSGSGGDQSDEHNTAQSTPLTGQPPTGGINHLAQHYKSQHILHTTYYYYTGWPGTVSLREMQDTR